MKKISLILPTRGRPNELNRLFSSIVEMTSQLDKIEVILYVDADDVGSHNLSSKDFHVTRIIGPALSMGGYNTACYEHATGEIIILINDDVVIRTPGWDDYVCAIHEKYSDEIYLAYPNDLFKKSKFCTFPIMSRRTCEILIEPFPVAYKRFFIDTHLFDIFKRLQNSGLDRIFYCDDLVFEHLHYRIGKASYDDTYGYGRKGRFADDSIFIELVRMRSAAAQRLTSAISHVSTPTKDSVMSSEGEMPTTVFAAVFFFTRKFLLDKELPYRWRFFLWFNFIGRYLASNAFLWQFGR